MDILKIFFQSKSIGYLFISLYHFQILSSVLYFSEYRSFTSLAKFLPRYFILFDVIVNETVSLSSLSDSPLLVYVNATDFYILLLCPVMLFNTFITSNSFFFHGDFRVVYVVSPPTYEQLVSESVFINPVFS